MLLANNCRRICKSSFIVLLIRLNLFQSWSRWLWNINLHSQHIRQTKTLYVAKCRIQGCGWKLRASVRHGPKTFWVTKYSKRMKNRKGWRMFLVHDGCTHGKLLEMTQEDYDLDNKIEKMVLTYSLPNII